MSSHMGFRSLSLFALLSLIIPTIVWASKKPAPPPPPPPLFYTPQLLPSVNSAAEKIHFLAPHITYGGMTGADRVEVNGTGVQMFFSESGTIQTTQYFWSWTGGYNAPVSHPYANSAVFSLIYSSLRSLRYADGAVYVCVQDGTCYLLYPGDAEQAHMLMDALLTLAVASGNTNVVVLDMTFDSVPAKDLKRLKLSDGRIIQIVDTGSRAEEAGVRAGDILYGVEGKVLDNTTGLSGIYQDAAIAGLKAHPEGCTIHVQGLRDGAPITFEMKVKPLFTAEAAQKLQANAAALAAQANGAPPAAAAPPAASSAPASGVKLGIQARNVNDEDAHAAKLAETRGVLVGSVDKGGLAETMKVQPGDIITEVNSSKITSLDDLKKMLQSGSVTSITVWRAGTAVKLEVPESL